MWQKLTLTALLAALAAAPLVAQYRLPPPQPGRNDDRDRSDRDPFDRDRNDRRDRSDRQARDDRQVWAYRVDGGGTFEHDRGDRWIQYRNEGTPINFREVGRTRDYVELCDDNRQLPVRLYGKMLYQDLGDGFVPGFEGWWK